MQLSKKLNFSSDVFTAWLKSTFNPIQNGLFWGCSRMRQGLFGPRSVKSGTQILQWGNLAQLYLTWGSSKKCINHVTHPLGSADISIFHRKSANFATSRNPHIDWILIYNFNFFNFSWVFSNCFKKHGYKFDDVSKNNYSRSS